LDRVGSLRRVAPIQLREERRDRIRSNCHAATCEQLADEPEGDALLSQLDNAVFGGVRLRVASTVTDA